MDARAFTRSRTAPEAWGGLREEALAAPSFEEAWALLREVLILPGSKVVPEALSLLTDLMHEADPATFLPVVFAHEPSLPVPLRLARVDAVEAAAGRHSPEALLEALAPLAVDGSDAVSERAATALGVLALHAPAVVGPRIEAWAATGLRKEGTAAAASLWGLASVDLPAALRALDRLLEAGDAVQQRRGLVQLGFAYRYRPFTAEERALFFDALTRAQAHPKGPGRPAVLEVALPLAPFNSRPEALADLDRFLTAMGRARAPFSPGRPPPRPLAPCGKCGARMDYAGYFCPECGD
ncbi:MAG TPA: hypothetical protein VNZ52_04205, partial [Candidatus Thermoplasmatota archaeon]|nr:hypothetical protein [Candidatus Thermoplasmatota archaeon]